MNDSTFGRSQIVLYLQFIEPRQIEVELVRFRADISQARQVFHWVHGKPQLDVQVPKIRVCVQPLAKRRPSAARAKISRPHDVSV